MPLSQDIESKINILDLVGRYVDMKKAGVNYKALCPFHSEKSPSFIISPQKNIAHCFSCGKGGGPIKFLMEIEKIEFREAISVLAKDAGVELRTDWKKEKSDAGGDIYALYRMTTTWYHEALYKEENKKYLEYLRDRKISDETIQKFQLGCSTSPRDLWFYLKEKGFTPQFLIDSGIFISEGRDKFFGRITFPIANSMGHTVAFTGRVLGDALPKYLNSPASNIFDKSSILYGLHLAKQTISKTGIAFIVEGQMDTISLHQAGVDNVVGISGTALTKEHIKILKRFSRTIYLGMDSDNAGIKAIFKSIENTLNEDIDVRIISIPDGKDPDEFIKNGGNYEALESEKETGHARMLSQAEETSLSIIEFYLKEGYREFDINSIIGRKKLIEKCLDLVAQLKSKIEIDMYIQQISRKLDISREILYSEYKTISRRNQTREKTPHESNNQNTIGLSKEVFTPAELLAGYISRYDFFDLFSWSFQYTTADLSGEGDFSLLSHVISRDPLDGDDEERLKVIILSLEEQHPEEDRALLEKGVLQLIKKLHELILVSEYRNALENGMNILELKRIYVPKAIALGLPQSVFR